jgi:putative endonuclease
MRGKGIQVQKLYFVYMPASRRNETLYTGVTNDIGRRVWERKYDLAEGFTKKYGVHILVWNETRGDTNVVIAREADQRFASRS